jgi:hypothetical protein
LAGQKIQIDVYKANYLNDSIWLAQKGRQEKKIAGFPNSRPFYVSAILGVKIEIGGGSGHGRLDRQ